MRSHFKTYLVFYLFVVFICSCRKNSEPDRGSNEPGNNELVKYTIQRGEHFSDQSTYEAIVYVALAFTVKFDSSAIYKTADPSNQEDINKLYGFSDNNANHQQFSARFGWNWARGALRLYAYVYNESERSSLEITTIKIGPEYPCSIKISGDLYIFSANDVTIEMPRASKTSEASGYKLFPYFGGNETAPHDISIWIKDL